MVEEHEDLIKDIEVLAVHGYDTWMTQVRIKFKTPIAFREGDFLVLEQYLSVKENPVFYARIERKTDGKES